METFRKCSNLPVIEDKFEPPFEKKLYIINKCQFDQSGLPPYLQEGFYKVEMRGYGTVNWYITFVFEVQNVMWKGGVLFEDANRSLYMFWNKFYSKL